ncbi:MAG: PLP-dependent cysteine synthase family protein [Gemmatimonadetes bacterium]|nr:PLP-dependent cysteine synthase family protein [Gemmatimonadota bacterium]
MNRVSVGPRILETVGNTDMIELGVPKGSARILMKLESQNPTGSMKDRMALAMIEAAEKDGRLQPGGHVVEYTAGSTGVSLAMVCAAKGYDLSIVTSDAFSLEKRNHMAAFGARLTVLPSVDGRMDEALTRGMIQAAHDIRDRVDGYLTDQLRNADQLPAYHRMGEEIWSQTGGRIDAFVQMTGTAASSRGVSEALHARDSSIFCVAVEPSESAVLSGGPSGSHRIEGVGAGFVAPLWDPDAVDDVATVSTEEAMETARRLAREEALCAGTSTGGNLFTTRALARELGPDATVVTVMCDSGSKYLTTELYGQSSPEPADG